MAIEINSLLSKELQVKPLKPGQTKIYRRVLYGTIDSQTDEPIVLSDYWQQGKAMIYDPFAKKNVLLLNATGERPISNPDGTTRFEPIVEMIKWTETGEIILTEEHFEQMCFMERSNLNKSNKFRNKRIRPLYEEVIKNKAVKEKATSFELLLQAGDLIKTSTIDDLKVLAQKLGVNAPVDTLRMVMMNKIQEPNGPRNILKNSTNIGAKKRIQILDAEEYGILLYNDAEGSWYFEDSLAEPICHVELNIDKTQGLVDFFSTKEGKGKYALLAKKIKKLYEAID
jgi:hypothetical protein